MTGGNKSGSSLPGTAVTVLAALAAVKALAHLATHHRYGYERDELYFIACAEHLAFGYVDHPPLLPWLTRISGELFDYSLASLRIWPIAALTVSLVVTGLMARRLGGSRFAQALAALSFLIAPLYLRLGTFLNIPSLEVLCWTLLSYLLIVIVKEERDQLWPWVGAVAGIGLLNKHSMLLFGFSLVAGLLLTPARKHLRSRRLWIGGAIAAAIFMPNLAWQVVNGFPTVEFLSNLNREVMADVSFADFMVGQVLYMHPFLLPLWLAGLWWYLAAAEGKPFRLMGVIFAVTFCVLLLAKSKVYYLAPAFPMLLASGAVAFETWTARGARARLRAPAVAALLAGGLVFAPAALPLLPIDTLDRLIPRVSLGLIEDPFELTEHFHKEFGWEEQVQAIASVYSDLPPARRARTAILAGNYGEAGAIDFFGRRHGLPKAISGHHSYYLWGPGDPGADTVISIGVEVELLRSIFDEVSEVTRIYHPRALPLENDVPVYLCTKPRTSLSQAWPKLRRFVRIN